MAQLLPRKKSSGQRFMEAFNQGPSVSSLVKDLSQRKAKEGQGLAKNLSALSGFLPKEFKARGRGSLAEDPQILAQFREEMRPLLEQGFEPYEAFEKVFSNYLQSPEGQSGMEEEPGMVQRLLGNILESKENPLPKQMGKPSEDALLNFIKEHPGKAALSGLLGTVSPFDPTHPPSQAAQELTQQLGFTLPHMQKESLSQRARKGILGEETTPREEKAAGQLELLGSLVPIGRLAKFFMPKGAAKGATAEKLLGAEAKEVKDLQKATQEGRKVKSLEGRVGKAPETATEARIQRAKPKERIYPKKERIATREEQLKRHPRYVREIEEDAAARAKRAERRNPKTEIGKKSKELRQLEARKRLPSIEDAYRKASARVRGIEDQMATMEKVARKEVEPILDLAKKELKDATFDLKNASENLEGISYRASAQEMRQAARNKLEKIREAFEEGKEFPLSKRDYSPELIRESKRLSKRKPLPYNKQPDFYQKVHQAYIDEYKTRLNQLQKQMDKLMKQRTLAGLRARRELAKEQDVIKKMIESAQSEQKIHRHKFGLRQMAERKKSQQRLGKLAKTKGKPKVKKVWEKRIRDLTSQEGRERVAREIVDEVKKGSPEKIKKILQQEEPKLKESLEKLHKNAEEIRTKFGKSRTNLPSSKETRDFYRKVKEFQKNVDNLLSQVPYLGKSRVGRDIIAAVIGGMWDAINDDKKIVPLHSGKILSFALGSGGAGRRSLRSFASNIVKGWIKDYMKENKIKKTMNLYRRHDDKALSKIKPSIRKEARERLYG